MAPVALQAEAAAAAAAAEAAAVFAETTPATSPATVDWFNVDLTTEVSVFCVCASAAWVCCNVALSVAIAFKLCTKSPCVCTRLLCD